MVESNQLLASITSERAESVLHTNICALGGASSSVSKSVSVPLCPFAIACSVVFSPATQYHQHHHRHQLLGSEASVLVSKTAFEHQL
ncbi:uncharacterized protein Dyak_GE27450, isoform A [Drosophila yakuba]|uniref:Uncharacterized protein, isoform A n=1 Tax=Drosophila yakuba TaxID=7245 RepID=A0A0R1DLR9_DROYA|nr:uncharacterized protein Dyak_GE27450, isoform A [Drosophila yakuba]